MFSTLRHGNQVHILHKSSTPFVEFGTVETTPALPMIGYYPNMPSVPIDISVRIGEKVVTYQQLPANLDSAEVTDKATGEQVFISCTREAINNELQTMRQESVNSINSVPYHKQRINAIDTLVGQLNPEIAEKQQQAQEINELRAQLADMKKLVDELKASSSNGKEN